MMTEEIAVYRAPDDLYRSPTLSRRSLGRHGYDLPDKSHRKDKKWSLSNIFRRKKKGDEEDGSGSSSDAQDGKRGFLGMRKRKPDEKRKRRVKTIGTFDHVVMPRRYDGHDENGVLSDPTGGFCNYVGRPLPRTPNEPPPPSSNDVEHSNSRASLDSYGRRSRKEMTKARAEARRRNASSSEDESQRSNSSLLIRSEENLRTRDAPAASKRSRAARTERYFKRHSRDGENPHNYLRLSKSDAESWNENRSPSRSPLLQVPNVPSNGSFSGLSTIPPGHVSHARFRVSNSTSNPSYRPPQSMNEYNHSTTRRPEGLQEQRSVSCDADIHRAPEAAVLHVQFPIVRGARNLSLIDQAMVRARTRHQQQPPPPPPRDPTRLHQVERPTTFYLDKSMSFSNPATYSQPRRPGARSSSEDHLPRQEATRSRHQENLSYLTDRYPRSRRPIQVQPAVVADQKALDFWKRIDMQNNAQPKQMFTSRTSVQTKVFLPEPKTCEPPPPVEEDRVQPRLPEHHQDQASKDDIKRKSANLEEALDELEAIYNSLRLGDEDLLERAEQREKESQELKHRLAHPPNYSARGALSDSSFSYEPFDSVVDSPRRRRRNRTVDLKHDDMAFRKLNRDHRPGTINDPLHVSRMSYLEASPVHGRAFARDDAPHEPDEPDVTQDDVVYRNIKDANTRLKVVEPQPPFGIPLGPIAPAANSDYLHARHQDVVVPYRPLFKHKKVPDVVKDDLAFRNLRKDENKGPALPPLSTEDYKNNNMDSLSYLKKKRAQRSLSANIGSLMHQDVIDRARRKQNNNDVENEFKTLTDIADAMEIARKVLREKDERITATKKAFMSDTDTPLSRPSNNERLTFLNSLRAESPEKVLSTKPPRGLTPERRRSPKESTPIPLSPLEANPSPSTSSSSSSLGDILHALAEEAKGTTERITNELLTKGEDGTSEHAKLCEKLLECVVDTTAPQVEEVVESMEEAERVESGAANVIVEREDGGGDDEHDYENLHSDVELEGEKCRSPFEERRLELIASFQELKRNVEEIELPRSPLDRRGKGDSREEPSENDHKPRDGIGKRPDEGPSRPTEEVRSRSFHELRLGKDRPEENVAPMRRTQKQEEDLKGEIFHDPTNEDEEELGSIYEGDAVTGEGCARDDEFVVVVALRGMECASNANRADGSESSSGFHSGCSPAGSANNLDSLEGLKSPRLVMATASRMSSPPSTSSSGGEVPRSSRLVLEASRNGKRAWYGEPANVALACSYGIACAHQLASLDLFAVLGVLFAVISFIAALFL